MASDGRRLALAGGAAAAFFLAGAGLLIWQFVDPSGPGAIFASHANVQAGEAVYAEHCASCHGARLEGQANWQTPHADGFYPAPPHDETGHSWHHPDQLLFDYTKHGGSAALGLDFKSNMPGFGDQLSDAEIRAVIDFIKSTWPDDIRQKQALLNQRAGKSEK